MEETIFYKYPEKLMRATGYIHPSSGELIELTANEKNIYVVMKKRNAFFDKHFDKQEDISELSGVSLKQTGRILRSFIDNEIIVANKGSSGQHKNWRYEKVAPLNLYQQKTQGLSKEFIELGVVEEDFWKSETKPAKKVNEWRGSPKQTAEHSRPPQYYEPTPSWMDMEDPF
jgi:hypothetical protein